MSRSTKTDPRQGNAGDLGKWLSKPKNREKIYQHDREAAAELAAMREAEGQSRHRRHLGDLGRLANGN